MKQALLAIVALFMVWVASAGYTGNVETYYQNNKRERTLDVGNLKNITMTNSIVYDKNGQQVALYYQDKVICNNISNMCYVGALANVYFWFDIDAFVAGQENATWKKVVFKNLFDVLY